jgi:hypothetical protein
LDIYAVTFLVSISTFPVGNPFDLRISNAETQEAIENSREGKEFI